MFMERQQKSPLKQTQPEWGTLRSQPQTQAYGVISQTVPQPPEHGPPAPSLAVP